MFNEASRLSSAPTTWRVSRRPNAAESPVTSPATRPTPTTETMPVASRCSSVTTERPTCHTAWGRRTITDAVPVNICQSASSTSVSDADTYSYPAVTPTYRAPRAPVTGVTVRSTVAPSRPTVSTADSPSGVAPTARWNCAKVSIGVPFHARTVSPGRTPASYAGEAISPSDVWIVADTEAIVRDAAGAPMPTMVTALSTKQISRFMSGPQSITVIFFGALSR